MFSHETGGLVWLRRFAPVLMSGFIASAPIASLATPLTMVHAAGPVLLSGQTGSINILFNINNALPQGTYSNPYQIVSGNASFSFSDNADLPISFGTTVGSYQQWGADYYDTDQVLRRDYYRDYAKTLFDPFDMVTVVTDGQSGAGGGTPYFDSTPVSSGSLLDYQSSFIYWVWLPIPGPGPGGIFMPYVGISSYYSNVTEHLTGFTGALDLAWSLTDADIQDLSQDGILSFTVSAASGDIYFSSAILQLTIEQNPIQTPEPGTVALVWLGLAGLVLVRRGG